MSVSAKEVAKYFLTKFDSQDKQNSHIKVQKLLYYSQGFWMVLNNQTALFPEKIEAWKYGPVVPDVYYNWNSGERIFFHTGTLNLKKDVTDFLDKIWNTFGDWTVSQLVAKTHVEAPWMTAVRDGKSEITLRSIYEYFQDKVK